MSLWEFQSDEQKEDYINLLKVFGSMTNLFSDSNSPYLNYRIHENLFCEIFEAKNLARGDISFDATKGKVGIGLKTFLNSNGKTFQKVAEFNSNSDLFREMTEEIDIVYKVAELRNKRIVTTQNMTETTTNLYHLITREPGKMNIIETPMDLINTHSIRIKNKKSKNTIHFTDNYNEYSFSLSKNTLLQRFDTTKDKIIHQFDVDILENPFDLIRLIQKNIDNLKLEDHQTENYIILPLYSAQRGDVPEKSGLNQWNAGGRVRHPNEAYIPIPSWIHKSFNDFFVYAKNRKFTGESAKNSPSFNIELPNGKIMTCKVAQAGGKALMSDPNKELGKWILRDVLNIPEGKLVTMNLLQEIGIDSVKLTKENDDYYFLDFMETGSYEEFELNNKK